MKNSPRPPQLLLAALLAVLPALAGAAPVPASTTISGGVSLGAYEAGLAYYSLEAHRANPGITELKLATGASAGSVNAFISLLQTCGAASPDPRQSLFWRTWIPLGLDQLTQPVGTGPTSAFSRRAFETPLALLAESWKGGLAAECDVVLGVSVTRLKPRLVPVKGEKLQLPRVEEKFLLRIQGRGPGQPPRLSNYADPAWEGEQALLPERSGGEVALESLVDVLYASTAFPGAFPPQAVKHCVVTGGAAWPGCTAATAREDHFVDGGVFDNTPIRLATRAAVTGLRPGEAGARWQDRPDFSRRGSPAGVIFSYVSPDVRTFPAAGDAGAQQGPSSLLGVASEVGGAFYDSARVKNLLYLHDEDPEFFENLVIPERHLPAASSPLGAFFGFFETELRVFDFYLGMYDARRTAEVRLSARLAKAGRAGPLRLPESLPASTGPVAAAAWQPYRCLAAVMDGSAEAAGACQGEALQDFRIVLQTSIERLWSRCADLGPGAGAFGGDLLCWEAAAGKPPRAVPGVAPLPAGQWRRLKGENEAAFLIRLLAAHRFEFRDLGLRRDQADEAPARLRRRLLQVGDQVADTQPVGQAGLVEAAVKLGADQVIYVPPRSTAWALYGRDLEGGLSYALTGGDSAVGASRLTASLQLNDTARMLSSEPDVFAFSAVAGLEVLPGSWASSALQPSLVLRGGMLFSAKDDFATSSCQAPDSTTVGSCSRPVVGVGLTATALERIRLQAFFNYYPVVKSGQVAWWTVAPALGVQWSF